MKGYRKISLGYFGFRVTIQELIEMANKEGCFSMDEAILKTVSHGQHDENPETVLFVKAGLE